MYYVASVWFRKPTVHRCTAHIQQVFLLQRVGKSKVLSLFRQTIAALRVSLVLPFCFYNYELCSTQIRHVRSRGGDYNTHVKDGLLHAAAKEARSTSKHILLLERKAKILVYYFCLLCDGHQNYYVALSCFKSCH